MSLIRSFLTVAQQVVLIAAEELSRPLLRRTILDMTPDGDGHTVMLKSGFLSGAWHMKDTKDLLQEKNYNVIVMPGRVNTRFDAEDVRQTVRTLDKAADKSGRQVTLLGESAGCLGLGLAAYERPRLVRNRLFHGGPLEFNAPGNVFPPLKDLFQRLNPRSAAEEAEIERRITGRLDDVPLTTVAPTFDVLVSTRATFAVAGPKTENLLLLGTHFGVNSGLNLMLMLNRVAQTRDGWRKFDERLGFGGVRSIPRPVKDLAIAA